MDKVFVDQLSHNVQVYVNDILVKILQVDELVPDLEETFATLRKYHMWLNLEKYIFHVSNGWFLGFMMSE